MRTTGSIVIFVSLSFRVEDDINVPVVVQDPGDDDGTSVKWFGRSSNIRFSSRCRAILFRGPIVAAGRRQFIRVPCRYSSSRRLFKLTTQSRCFLAAREIRNTVTEECRWPKNTTRRTVHLSAGTIMSRAPYPLLRDTQRKCLAIKG